MSEFTCKNGHLMRGYRCQECGAPVDSEDGVSDNYYRPKRKNRNRINMTKPEPKKQEEK